MPVSTPPPAIFVDVDDTLVRSFGGKRLPIVHMIALVRSLSEHGAELYCWSTGGADYARRTAEELGLTECFRTFLPKPSLVLDDLGLATWNLIQLHPAECGSLTATEVLARLER